MVPVRSVEVRAVRACEHEQPGGGFKTMAIALTFYSVIVYRSFRGSAVVIVSLSSRRGFASDGLVLSQTRTTYVLPARRTSTVPVGSVFRGSEYLLLGFDSWDSIPGVDIRAYGPVCFFRRRVGFKHCGRGTG